MAMSDGENAPVYIERASLADLPSVERIASLAERVHQIVLSYATHFVIAEQGSEEATEPEKRRLLADLAARLPDHSVFASTFSSDQSRDRRLRPRVGETVTGKGHITILKVISRARVMENARQLVDAARQFRTVADDLMERLARRLRAEPIEFAADPMFWRKFKQTGLLDAEWHYFFHGFECGFRHQQTGQVVEVCFGFTVPDENPDRDGGETTTPEFGVLDPDFFARFVRSTPGLENIADLFRDNYHDPGRALDVLLETGWLARIGSSGTWGDRWGVAAARGEGG